jgi:hypothetical protein
METVIANDSEAIQARLRRRTAGIMPGLAPGIHAEPLQTSLTIAFRRRRVDGRDKPGHDGGRA